jgi:hypothetical protein
MLPRSTKTHRALLEEMEVPKLFFSIDKFLASSFVQAASVRFALKGARRFVGKIFKLKDQRRAILSEGDHRTVIPIPARATVVVMGGDIDEDPFVKIRYGGRVLLMHSEDLRNSGELLGRLP